MFEDKLIRETPYGRLIRLDECLTPQGISGIEHDVLLVTSEGNRFFDEFFGTEDGFKGVMQQLVLANYLENKYLRKIPGEDFDLMFKINPLMFMTGSPSEYGQELGALMEIATLAEIQKYMADRGNEGKSYQFVPHRVHFGSRNLVLTDWIRQNGEGQKLDTAEYFKMKDALEEFKQDLTNIGLHLDTAGSNLPYLGKNSHSKKYQFGVIDQMDIGLAERMK